MTRYRSSSAYNQLLIADIMSKIIFMEYLPPVRPKLVLKLKMLRIYWNLAHYTFQICQCKLWCRKWFLWNIYQLLCPNWSQKWKIAEFIEIHNVWYFNNNAGLFIYLFIYLFRKRSIAYLRNYKFKGFLTIFLHNLTCIFIDDLNFMDFFVQYSFVNF